MGEIWKMWGRCTEPNICSGKLCALSGTLAASAAALAKTGEKGGLARVRGRVRGRVRVRARVRVRVRGRGRVRIRVRVRVRVKVRVRVLVLALVRVRVGVGAAWVWRSRRKGGWRRVARRARRPQTRRPRPCCRCSSRAAGSRPA